jgi:hypothetical protein
MSGPEAEEGFKVTDRRRRPQGPDAAPRAPVSETTSAAASGSPGGSHERTGPREPRADDDRSLVGLFVMLGTTAAVALGSPDPVTGESQRDPVQAAAMIDLLVLLRERTEGNRTPEETQVLDELIYDLQLRYVEVMKRSG